MTRPAHDAPNAKKDSTMIRLPRTARPRRALVAFLLSAALLIPAGVALAHATQDAAEAALYHGDPTENLRLSIVASRWSWAAEDETGLVALWGAGARRDEVVPWLMSSERVEAHPRALLGLGRRLVEWCRESGLQASNYIGKASHSNRRFVRRLGFLIEPLPVGPFDRFYLP